MSERTIKVDIVDDDRGVTITVTDPDNLIEAEHVTEADAVAAAERGANAVSVAMSKCVARLVARRKALGLQV